ncbi:hypothetical protein F5Y12DRAFT_102108 [Xylaria sp. FL1777]|nr:hypothetical protein F5Y12DRAFT_102108 [Xylaria sp. FL1777]
MMLTAKGKTVSLHGMDSSSSLLLHCAVSSLSHLSHLPRIPTLGPSGPWGRDLGQESHGLPSRFPLNLCAHLCATMARESRCRVVPPQSIWCGLNNAQRSRPKRGPMMLFRFEACPCSRELLTYTCTYAHAYLMRTRAATEPGTICPLRYTYRV